MALDRHIDKSRTVSIDFSALTNHFLHGLLLGELTPWTPIMENSGDFLPQSPENKTGPLRV